MSESFIPTPTLRNDADIPSTEQSLTDVLGGLLRSAGEVVQTTTETIGSGAESFFKLRDRLKAGINDDIEVGGATSVEATAPVVTKQAERQGINTQNAIFIGGGIGLAAIGLFLLAR